MRIPVSILAAALLLAGCQRLPQAFSPFPVGGGSTATPPPSGTSSGVAADILQGQSIFHNGNGNGTPGCVSCHPGTMLAGEQAADIKTCLSQEAPMIQRFGPNGLAPLSATQIAAIAAYIASPQFPN